MQCQVLTAKNPILAILAPNILNSLSSHTEFWSNLHSSAPSFLFWNQVFVLTKDYLKGFIIVTFMVLTYLKSLQTPILSPLKNQGTPVPIYQRK